MAANKPPRNPAPLPAPLNDVLSSVLDPVLRKRAGISLSLVQSWEEIVGPFAAARSRPDKVIWPRARSGHEAAGGATLVIACEASAALELQHETSEIIARVNNFLGHAAVTKVKLVQKAVAPPEAPKRRTPAPVGAEERRAIAHLTSGIADEGLRAALERLGASVKGSRKVIKSP